MNCLFYLGSYFGKMYLLNKYLIIAHVKKSSCSLIFIFVKKVVANHRQMWQKVRIALFLTKQVWQDN